MPIPIGFLFPTLPTSQPVVRSFEFVGIGQINEFTRERESEMITFGNRGIFPLGGKSVLNKIANSYSRRCSKVLDIGKIGWNRA